MPRELCAGGNDLVGCSRRLVRVGGGKPILAIVIGAVNPKMSQGGAMGIFLDNDILEVFHYTPLHYLPFIARSQKLLGKPSLAALGFGPKHLRSMSSRQDVERGFGEYGFLTLDDRPRILGAKLLAGFPHIGIKLPSASVEAVDFALCRYNVAMTRFLRRGNKPGFRESEINGRYYGDKQIPIAVEHDDKATMLTAFAHSDTMIEVLLSDDFDVPNNASVVCYSVKDANLATEVMETLGVAWEVQVADPSTQYNRDANYVAKVEGFIQRAMEDPDWRGNGLEFDRV